MYTVIWTLIPDLGLDLTYIVLHDAVSPEAAIRFCVLLSFVLMLGAVWHYLRVARMIDEGSYAPARMKIVGAALAVLVLGGTSLVWLLW